MIAHGLAPIIDDKVTRNPLRLALLPPALPPASAFTDITNEDKNKPLTPFKSGGAAALTQEERDRKSKAEAAGRALAALDGEIVESDETPESDEESDGGKDDPPDGGNQVPPAGKAPSAKERRAAVAAEKKKEKQAKAEEAKAQKEAKKAEKLAAKSSGAGGKRKRGQVGVA